MSFLSARMSVDHLNFLLIVVCAALAYVLPFELVLISYAILGPAHYLTQINWMHKREYFTPDKLFLYLAIIATAVAVMVPHSTGPALFVAMAFAVASLLQVKRWVALALVAVASCVYLPLALHVSVVDIVFALLLPTVIHVFVFTWLFMLSGALRGRSVWGVVNVVSMLAVALAFFFIPPSSQPVFYNFVMSNSGMFVSILPRVGDVLGFKPSVEAIASFMGFLSFAYTYHYLNWFSKAEVIQWHKTTTYAWGMIALCYVISVGVYVYDYKTGFVVLLFLSVLHVALEFPLNIQTIRGLPKLVKATAVAWGR